MERGKELPEIKRESEDAKEPHNRICYINKQKELTYLREKILKVRFKNKKQILRAATAKRLRRVEGWGVGGMEKYTKQMGTKELHIKFCFICVNSRNCHQH